MLGGSLAAWAPPLPEEPHAVGVGGAAQVAGMRFPRPCPSPVFGQF